MYKQALTGFYILETIERASSAPFLRVKPGRELEKNTASAGGLLQDCHNGFANMRAVKVGVSGGRRPPKW